MSRVFLLNPYYKKKFIHNARWSGFTISSSNWGPVFLAYCTGLLEKNHHEVKLVDAEAENLKNANILKIIQKFTPDYVVAYPSVEGFAYLEKLLKEIEAKIILVGPWICAPNIKNSQHYDFLVKGQFEYPVLNIVEGKINKKITQGKPLTKKQINNLPWVSKVYVEHLNLDKYQIGSLEKNFVDMFVDKRACFWGKCNFCLYPQTLMKCGKDNMQREVKDVLDELEFISNTYSSSPFCMASPKIKEVFFQDGTVSPERLKKISHGLLVRKIKIKWSTYARGDFARYLNREDLLYMKESGCHCFHLGIESSSNKLLKYMNKGTTKEELEKFVEMCNDVKIDIHADFMIGTTHHETENTIKNTIEWGKKLNVKTYQISTPRAYPGTAYYEYLNKNGYLDEKGRVNYPHLSHEKMEEWCKAAMKRWYFRWDYIKRVIFDFNELKRVLRSGIHVIFYLFTNKKQVDL